MENLLLEAWREDVPILHLENKTRELRGSDRKQIQQYKTTAVYQKAAEERRHAEERDPNMVCIINFSYFSYNYFNQSNAYASVRLLFEL